MKKIINTIALSLAVVALMAQQGDHQHKLRISSFGSSIGFAAVVVSNTSSDFKSLMENVEDPELFYGLEKYTESKYNYGAGGNANLLFNIGLTPYSNKKGEYRNDREFRITMGFSFGARRTFSYINRNTYQFDTYQSTAGNILYADSTIFTRMTYVESYYGIGMGVSYLFKTAPERRFHFYTGGGLDYGLALRSFVNVKNYTESSLYYYTEGNKPEFDEPEFQWMKKDDDKGTTTTTQTNMKSNGMFLRPYIPLGVNFRISNRTQSFFKQVYLFTEINPGIEFQIVPNEETYINPYFGVAMLGFTYRW
ncbi:MAG: hypothetical protein JW830_16250 [Bacteroidales bacterium]|nr:hypothetical protein [Bacteroidales bacterium]